MTRGPTTNEWTVGGGVKPSPRRPHSLYSTTAINTYDCSYYDVTVK